MSNVAPASIENNTITVQNQGKVLTIVKRSSKVFIKRNIIPEKTIDQTVSRAVGKATVGMFDNSYFDNSKSQKTDYVRQLEGLVFEKK